MYTECEKERQTALIGGLRKAADRFHHGEWHKGVAILLNAGADFLEHVRKDQDQDK